MKRSFFLLFFLCVIHVSAQTPLHVTPDTGIYTMNGGIKSMELADSIMYVGGSFDTIFKQKMGITHFNSQGESFHKLHVPGEVIRAVPDGRGGAVVMYDENPNIHNTSYVLAHVGAEGLYRPILSGYGLADVIDFTVTGDTVWLLNETNTLEVKKEYLAVFSGQNIRLKESLTLKAATYRSVSDGKGGMVMFLSNYRDYRKTPFLDWCHLDSFGKASQLPPLFRADIVKAWQAGKYLFLVPSRFYPEDSSSLIIIDMDTWQRLSVDLRIAGSVSSVKVHSDTAYIAGDFTAANSAYLPHLFRYALNTLSLDTAWKPQPSGKVTHIELDSHTLTLGGGFTHVFGKPAQGIVQLYRDYQDSFRVFLPFVPQPRQFLLKGDTVIIAYQDNNVLNVKAYRRVGMTMIKTLLAQPMQELLDMSRVGNDVWMVTQYDHDIDSSICKNVAVFDANSLKYHIHKSTPLRAYLFAASDSQYSMFLSGLDSVKFQSNLFGVDLRSNHIVHNEWFPTKASFIESRDRELYIVVTAENYDPFYKPKLGKILRFDFEQGGLDTGFMRVTGGTVLSLNVVNDNLIFFGSSVVINGTDYKKGAWLDLTTNTLKPWKASQSVQAGDVAVLHGNVYTSRAYIKGMSPTASVLTAFDSAGNKLSWSPKTNDWVRGLVAHHDTLFIFGWFTSYKQNPAYSYAVATDTSGAVLNWKPTFWGKINGAYEYNSGSMLAYGARFRTHIKAHKNLFAYDLKTKTLVDWDPHPAWEVNRLVIDGDSLWVGGGDVFTLSDTATNLIVFDRKALSRINSPRVSGWIYNFCLAGDHVYLSGFDLWINGQNVGSTGAIHRKNYTAKNWSTGMTNPAFRMEPYGENILIHPSSEQMIQGSMRKVYLADTVNGTVANWPFTFNNWVGDITSRDSFFYSIGGFDQVNSTASLYYAKLSLGRAEPYPNNYSFASPFIALHTSGKRVYVAGYGSLAYIDQWDSVHYATHQAGGDATTIKEKNDRLFGGSYYTHEVFLYQAYGSYLGSVKDPGIAWMDTGKKAFCSGDTLKIKVSAGGENYEKGNQFYIYLSDLAGKEPAGEPIAVVQSDTGGSIAYVLPADMPPSLSYRLFVIASQPLSRGSKALPFELHGQFNKSIEINDPEQCYRSNRFICVNKDSVRTFSIQWEVDNQVFSGNRLDYTFAHAGTDSFRVTISDAYCTENLVLPVEVHQEVPVHLTVTANTHLCDSNHRVFFYDSIPGSKLYLFDPGFGDVLRSLPVDIHFPAYGRYEFELIGMDSNFCTDTSRQSLVIGDREFSTIKLHSDSVQCLTGNEYLFTAHAPQRSKTIIAWIGYEADTIQKDSFRVNFTMPGYHSVLLISHDSNYCVDSVAQTVFVRPGPAIPVLDGPGFGYYADSNTYFASSGGGDSIVWWSDYAQLVSSSGAGQMIFIWPPAGSSLPYVRVGAQTIDTSMCLSDTVIMHIDLFHVSLANYQILSWKIFPNPTSGDVYVIAEENELAIRRIAIYNAQGKKVNAPATRSLNGWTISFENLPAGWYMIELEGEEGEIDRGVVQRID